MIYEYMKDIRISAFIMGVISVFLILFTFLNFLNKNNKRAKYFFLGTSLMPFADVLMAISYYIDTHTTYIIIYHYMYYIARYLIYKSMVTDTKE